jgi:hypothetical protein
MNKTKKYFLKEKKSLYDVVTIDSLKTAQITFLSIETV